MFFVGQLQLGGYICRIVWYSYHSVVVVGSFVPRVLNLDTTHHDIEVTLPYSSATSVAVALSQYRTIASPLW